MTLTKIKDVGKDVEKSEILNTVGMSVQPWRKILRAPLKIKNRTTIGFCNPTSSYISKTIKIRIMKT
jgi:hypothetical protein